MRPMVRLTFLCAAVCALVLAAPAAAERYMAGSPGLGDELFPNAGNGGYDVGHYDLALDYDPATDRLEGRAVITATATQDLDQFDLDLRDWAGILKLEVNGHAARFAFEGEQELVITPRPKLKAGRTFEVEVQYVGVPPVIVDPDESIEGWVHTDDGAFVVNEPQGSPGWYPANDNPQDKATYDMAITVPEGRAALGNGVLLGESTSGGRTTWRWRESRPMASYLATATNGTFNLSFTTLPNGLPFYQAVDPRRSGANLAIAGQVIDLFSQLYGPYPWEAAGGIVDFAPDVGYALETQTKANYANSPGTSTVVHEISHEWFGNAVTLRRWRDIWLNEGFARWSEWIWTERTGGRTAQAAFDAAYATPATNTGFWNPPPADPGDAASIFDGTIYTRGAMTLQALRQKIGDDDFFELLRTWYARHRYGNASTEELIALAEEVSGRDLGDFFRIWLYTPGKPAPGSW
jgi:aminopeptidase N